MGGKSDEAAAEGQLLLHPAGSGRQGEGPQDAGALLGSALRHLLDGAEAAAVTDVRGKLLYANAGFEAALPALLAARPGGSGEGISFLPELVALVTPRPDAWSEPVASDLLLPAEAGREALRLHLAAWAEPGGQLHLVALRLLPEANEGLLRRDLDQLRARFEDVVRLVSDWVWESDRELRLTFISGRVLETLGLPPRQLAGRPLTALFESAPAALLGLLSETGRKPFRDLEVIALGSDGQQRHLRLSGVPLFDSTDGRFLGFRGTGRDVTEALRREADLRRSRELAEAASLAKSHFLATISHELRTPLNAIIGFSEIMARERFGPLGTPAYRGYAADVLRSAEHLLGLINAILDLSRVEAGKRELEEEKVWIEGLFDDARRLLEGDARAAEVDLVIEPAPEDAVLRGDPRALLQILLNLLGNAIKFTPAGREVRLAAPEAAEGEALVLEVRDQGIGMTPEEVEVALTPFGQVDSGLARRYQGTGLGLPLARGLTELHGGRLEVESHKGVGTRVRVLLPPERRERPTRPAARS